LLIIPHLYCFAGTIPKVWFPLQDSEIRALTHLGNSPYRTLKLFFGKERENEEEFPILL